MFFQNILNSYSRSDGIDVNLLAKLLNFFDLFRISAVITVFRM